MLVYLCFRPFYTCADDTLISDAFVFEYLKVLPSFLIIFVFFMCSMARSMRTSWCSRAVWWDRRSVWSPCASRCWHRRRVMLWRRLPWSSSTLRPSLVMVVSRPPTRRLASLDRWHLVQSNQHNEQIFLLQSVVFESSTQKIIFTDCKWFYYCNQLKNNTIISTG